MEQEKLVVQNTLPLLDAPICEQTQAAIKKTEVKTKYDMIDFIYVFVFAVLGYLYYKNVSYIWQTGVGACLFTFAYALSFGTYIRLKTKNPLPKQSYFWLAILLLTGVSFALYTNYVFSGVNTLFLHLVAIYWPLSASGSLIDKKTGKYFVLDGFYALIIYPFAKYFAPIFAIANGIKKPFKNIKTEKIGATIIGILLGLLSFCFVLPLLLNADANFANLFNVFTYFNFDEQIIVSLIFPCVIGSFFASLAFSCCSQKNERKTTIDKSIKRLGVIPQTSVNVAIAMLAALYAVFISSSLFKAIEIVLNINIKRLNYSAYARQGFFELCKVVLITILILALVAVLTKKETQKNKPYTVVLLTICALSLCLVAIAAIKMWLYVNAYGLTGKRFFASIFMAFLALIFVMIIINEFKRFDYIRAAVAVFCVGTCFLLMINSSSIITSYNISQYKSGALKYNINTDVKVEYDNAAAVLDFYNSLPEGSENKEIIKKDLVAISRVSDNQGDLFAANWFGLRASRIEGFLRGLNNY